MSEEINHHSETGGTFSGPGLEDMKSATEALGSFMLHGRKPVSPDQAEARAVICASCPKQVEVDGGCGACRGLYALARRVVGDKLRTTQDGNLRVCGVCRCHGVAQVHVPVRDLSEGVRDEHMIEPSPESENDPSVRVFPGWCWKRLEVLEYRAAKESNQT